MLLALAVLLGWGCRHAQIDPAGVLSQPEKKLSTYAFDPAKPLAERIGPCPEALVEVYREFDAKPEYQPYAPTPEEKALVAGYLDGLPEGMKTAFRERLIGVYFIKDLLGNGLSDFVFDERDPKAGTYSVIFLNPAGFGRTLSETLTLRERSAFKGEAAVSIDCGAEHRGILYSVLHEGTHAYDYIRGITPYVEVTVPLILGDEDRVRASWDVWDAYAQPGKAARSEWWGKLKFYGGGGGPLIEAKDVPAVYADLLRSPFASLYSTLAWAEDAAELVLFYHITQKLGQPYVVRVPSVTGGPDLEFEPMRSERTLARAKKIYDGL